MHHELETGQFALVSEVLTSASRVAPAGWTELMIRYYVEGDRSAQVVTCLAARPQGAVEEALPYDPELDPAMRRLRDHLAQAGRPPFTQARLHLRADGAYEADYGYDPVDWDALLQPRWNFDRPAR